MTVTMGEVLAAKFESPEYWAVIELLATGRVVTFRVARATCSERLCSQGS